MRAGKIQPNMGAYLIADAELVLEALVLLAVPLAPWLFDVALPVLPLATSAEL
jgi:hypothetical protein